MRLFKTGEKRGKGRIKKLIALVVAGTMLAGSVSYAATKVKVAPKGLSKDLDIMNTNELVKDSYTNQSGFCTDNEGNFYIARTRNSDNTVRLFKCYKDNNKWQIKKLNGWQVKTNQIFNIGHANDMTYCNRDGKIYVCIKGGNNTSEEPVIGVINKEGKCKDVYTKDQLKCSPSGIAYDEINEVFYLTRKSNGQYIVSVLDINGKTITPKNDGKSVVLKLDNFVNYEVQGITCRGDYLFVSLWEPHKTVNGKTHSGEGPNNSLVVSYKIGGDKKEKFTFTRESTIRFDHNTDKKSKFEIEGISFVGNRLYMAVNADSNGEGKNDKIGDNNGDAIYSYSCNFYTDINDYHNKMIEEKNARKSKGK